MKKLIYPLALIVMIFSCKKEDTCHDYDEEKSKKIEICHKGKTISISENAWPAHRAHGDSEGPCRR